MRSFSEIVKDVAEGIEDAARAAKDGTLKFFIEKALSKYIEDMLDFKIRPDEKSIYLKVLLKGETEPTVFHIRKYEIEQKEEGDFMIIRELFISKEWMHILAQEQMLNKPIDISKAKVLLKLHLI